MRQPRIGARAADAGRHRLAPAHRRPAPDLRQTVADHEIGRPARARRDHLLDHAQPCLQRAARHIGARRTPARVQLGHHRPRQRARQPRRDQAQVPHAQSILAPPPPTESSLPHSPPPGTGQAHRTIAGARSCTQSWGVRPCHANGSGPVKLPPIPDHSNLARNGEGMPTAGSCAAAIVFGLPVAGRHQQSRSVGKNAGKPPRLAFWLASTAARVITSADPPRG